MDLRITPEIISLEGHAKDKEDCARMSTVTEGLIDNLQRVGAIKTEQIDEWVYFIYDADETHAEPIGAIYDGVFRLNRSRIPDGEAAAIVESFSCTMLGVAMNHPDSFRIVNEP